MEPQPEDGGQSSGAIFQAAAGLSAGVWTLEMKQQTKVLFHHLMH